MMKINELFIDFNYIVLCSFIKNIVDFKLANMKRIHHFSNLIQWTIENKNSLLLRKFIHFLLQSHEFHFQTSNDNFSYLFIISYFI